MRYTPMTAFAVTSFLVSPAMADVPNVVTDIPPVQSLVAQVMGDLGTPQAIVPSTANAHAFSLRPSDARGLANADVIFWIGEDLLPSMDRALANLAGDAVAVKLLDVAGATVLTADDDHGHGEHEGHGHDDHAEDKHDDHGDDGHDEHGHDEHGHDEHDDHGNDDKDAHHHDHDGVDPHAWMSPKNAALWLDVIAQTLADADPDHAETYRANAQSAVTNLERLSDRMIATYSDQMGDHAVVTFHDTLRYFEDTFDTGPVITIPLGDGQTATPSQLAELKDQIEAAHPKCALTDEAGENTGMTAMAQDAGLELRVLNPLGAGIEPGPGLYAELIERTFALLADCR